MRRNLSRCCRAGTQENEGKMWNTWLLSLWSVYWFGLCEEIVSLNNIKCVVHRPGEEALLNLLWSQIALHYARLWMCIVYMLVRGQMRTRHVATVELAPLWFGLFFFYQLSYHRNKCRLCTLDWKPLLLVSWATELCSLTSPQMWQCRQ